MTQLKPYDYIVPNQIIIHLAGECQDRMYHDSILFRLCTMLKKSPDWKTKPLLITKVQDNEVWIDGFSETIDTQHIIAFFQKLERNQPYIDLSEFYSVARHVKPRNLETVSLHLAAEVGEIAEALIQPDRGGDVIEEAVDAILCGLDLVYLEMKRRGKSDEETSAILNKTIATKLGKWYRTCS